MALYRYFLLSLALPVWLIRQLVLMALGRETREDFGERLGGGPSPGVARGPVVWLHGASVGELTAARPLAEALLDADPRLSLIVTANTLTGRAAVARWDNARVTARLAPVDARWALARFFATWQPAALIQVENEIWPNRMAMARERRIPVMAAAARLSERSARLWGRFPKTAHEVLGLVDHFAPQDAGTRDRLLALGVEKRAIGRRMNLKAAVELAPADPDEVAAFAAALPRAKTILAASTHPGEEEIVLTAFRKAREFDSHLKLIVAPRHPERGEEVAKIVAQAGQPLARRSKGEMPGRTTSVYIADTTGEMALWYRLAAVTFVGGSLVPKGGHTPYEPARAGSAVIHGPHVANNADAYKLLRMHKAEVEVPDAGSLTAEFLKLLGNAEGRAKMTARAQRALDQLGASESGIEEFVAQLAILTGNPGLAPKPARKEPV